MMWKASLTVAALVVACAAQAQQPAAAPPAIPTVAAMEAACPAGTHYATFRHNTVNVGKWAEFEHAVADHTAWYASKGSRTQTRIVRVLEPQNAGPGLSTVDAVTVTTYAGEPPEHDAGYAAFTAEYRDSASIKEELRLCLPAL